MKMTKKKIHASTHPSPSPFDDDDDRHASQQLGCHLFDISIRELLALKEEWDLDQFKNYNPLHLLVNKARAAVPSLLVIRDLDSIGKGKLKNNNKDDDYTDDTDHSSLGNDKLLEVIANEISRIPDTEKVRRKKSAKSERNEKSNTGTFFFLFLDSPFRCVSLDWQDNFANYPISYKRWTSSNSISRSPYLPCELYNNSTKNIALMMAFFLLFLNYRTQRRELLKSMLFEMDLASGNGTVNVVDEYAMQISLVKRKEKDHHREIRVDNH
jgi:hypothetical protein